VAAPAMAGVLEEERPVPAHPPGLASFAPCIVLYVDRFVCPGFLRNPLSIRQAHRGLSDHGARQTRDRDWSLAAGYAVGRPGRLDARHRAPHWPFCSWRHDSLPRESDASRGWRYEPVGPGHRSSGGR
jgi:hypothetical protein